MQYQQIAEGNLLNPETEVFEVRKGESLAEIAQQLQDRQLLDAPLCLRILAHVEGLAGRLRYGEYEIPPHLPVRQFLALLTSGKQKQHSLTFPEGWRFQQMLSVMEAHPAMHHRLESEELPAVLAELGIADGQPEGWFFPDTYYFTKGTTDVELLQRAHARMRQLLEREWRDKDPSVSLQNPQQALTLASIV
jgi:UPF0755 protein